MELKTCPKCGLINPPTTEVCDCGHDFAAKSGPVGQQALAVVWRRLGAFVVDTIALGLFGSLLGFVVGRYFHAPDGSGALLGFAVAGLYFTAFDSRLGRGRTPGKRLLGIKLVRKDGSTLSAPLAFLRYCIPATPYFLNGTPLPIVPSPLATAVGSFLVFGLGLCIVYLYVFNSQTRQTLQDLPFGTYVVREWADPPFATKAIWPGHYAMCAGLLVLSVAGVASMRSDISEARAERLRQTRTSLLVLPDVVDAAVSDDTVELLGRTTTPSVTASVYLATDRVGDEALAALVAGSVLRVDPDARKRSAVRVVFLYGYDLGIAKIWNRHAFSHSPPEWEKRAEHVPGE